MPVNRIRRSITLASVMLLSVAVPAYATWKTGIDKKTALIRETERAVNTFKETDPGLSRFFDTSYGWAVFPTVGKGGFGVGGAYGEGIVFEQGRIVGHTSLTQLSVGLQWGGQGYSEIIFFKDKEHLDKFKEGNFRLGAAVSAVVATLGASADADFSEGLAIFTNHKGGLMYEASVAGQKFKYWAY